MLKNIDLGGGMLIEASTDNELIAQFERYLAIHHPSLSGRLSRTQILAMAAPVSGMSPVEPPNRKEKAMTTQAIDEARLESFAGQLVTDCAAALGGLLTWAGDQLGLYKALAGNGPTTPSELARKTRTNERMVREWLLAQAAAGYLDYDGKAFTLSPEAAMTLADESSPVLLAGFFEVITAAYQAREKVLDAFRTGKGLGWGDHDAALFHGTERFFRPGYEANLVQSWIPTLDGAEAKLQAGAKVADVGCGHGASTIIMAKAYPNSTFYGYDYHKPSIEAARKRAADAGVADRVTFEHVDSSKIPALNFDLIAYFDCLHDMADPVGAAKAARKALAPGGSILLVEPNADDDALKNMNPVGRTFYAASTVICTPCSLDGDGPALGAQAGPKRLADVFATAGLKSFRVATSTPFNIVCDVCWCMRVCARASVRDVRAFCDPVNRRERLDFQQTTVFKAFQA